MLSTNNITLFSALPFTLSKSYSEEHRYINLSFKTCTLLARVAAIFLISDSWVNISASSGVTFHTIRSFSLFFKFVAFTYRTLSNSSNTVSLS